MRLAPGGLRYAAVLSVAAVPAWFLVPRLTVVFVACAAGTLLFYRDPERTPDGDGLVAPADGRVKVIRDEHERLRVGVFMNVWDVHVNRAPLSGTVESVEHEPGAHRPAFFKEADENERVRIDYETTAGHVRITLIAGAFARRIHPYVSTGDDLERAARIGHISFGSRADVSLPPDISRADLCVERGDRVTAGKSVLVPGDALDEPGSDGK
jgi:phosphatidylserine decarboxylase